MTNKYTTYLNNIEYYDRLKLMYETLSLMPIGVENWQRIMLDAIDVRLGELTMLIESNSGVELGSVGEQKMVLVKFRECVCNLQNNKKYEK